MADLIAAFLFVLAVLLSPKRCRDGWFVQGVRPSGATTCEQAPPPRCGEPVPPYQQPCPASSSYPMAIYCTGGSRPIVVDYRTVGCTR